MVVGFGTLKLDGLPGRPCTARRCPGHDGRVKVVATPTPASARASRSEVTS
jgi:hypothetical protein